MRWKFTENYDKTPLLSWIIISLKDTVNLNAKKKKNVNMTIKNITEIIITSTKLKKNRKIMLRVNSDKMLRHLSQLV